MQQAMPKKPAKYASVNGDRRERDSRNDGSERWWRSTRSARNDPV